jgi:hypothetical protein
LRDNFRKELKKADKPRSGDGAPPQTPRWAHFKVLQLLIDVMEPGKASGNIEFTPVCITQQQQSQEEEINLEESKECEIQSTFSEDATSEIQDPSQNTYSRPPKRKRGKSTLRYQEEMISLENKKLEWLIKQEEGNDEDLNFFRYLVPHMKKLPPTRKLFLRSQFRNMVADEITALQNNLHNF